MFPGHGDWCIPEAQWGLVAPHLEQHPVMGLKLCSPCIYGSSTSASLRISSKVWTRSISPLRNTGSSISPAMPVPWMSCTVLKLRLILLNNRAWRPLLDFLPGSVTGFLETGVDVAVDDGVAQLHGHLLGVPINLAEESAAHADHVVLRAVVVVRGDLEHVLDAVVVHAVALNQPDAWSEFLVALAGLAESELLGKDVGALRDDYLRVAGVGADDHLAVPFANLLSELAADDVLAEVVDVIGVAYD
jgi:hypothetical protein